VCLSSQQFHDELKFLFAQRRLDAANEALRAANRDAIADLQRFIKCEVAGRDEVTVAAQLVAIEEDICQGRRTLSPSKDVARIRLCPQPGQNGSSCTPLRGFRSLLPVTLPHQALFGVPLAPAWPVRLSRARATQA
jgi:hypothetical protein